MKKVLLILGILLIVVGVLCLLTGGLFWFVGVSTKDGSPEFYARRYRLAGLFLIVGLVLTAAGILCLVCRRKLAK